MDPEATLVAIRAAISDYYRQEDPDAALDRAQAAISGFEALDEWLTKGGFLPSDWTKGQQ